MPDPADFARFTQDFEQGRFAEALQQLDRLIAAEPASASLRWHRARCLERLERFAEIEAELEAVLMSEPDHVPAILMRVRWAGAADEPEPDGESLSDAERERRSQERDARNRRRSLAAEAELRRALALEPANADVLYALSCVLFGRDDAPELAAESASLLDQAIALAPRDVEMLGDRASRRRSAAMRFDDAPDDEDSVRNFSGMRFSRRGLEGALADHLECHARSGEPRHLVRAATVLHDLGRFDEALDHYDRALAAMPADDPRRAVVTEMRGRSENQGAGEREQLARLLESTLVGDGRDRTVADDVAASNLMALAGAIRAGRPVAEAVETQFPDSDPDLVVATDIAQKILNQAYEPPPELTPVDAGDYPAYQRRFAERCSKEIVAAGLRVVGDAEAKGMFAVLGQRVLLRLFADEAGETGVAAVAMKPKWPGWIGFLVMWFGRQWKVATLIECVTQFEDGTHLSTQHENASPFEYGGHIQIERLPRRTPTKDLIARHAERVADHKARNPGAVAVVATDIAGMDRRWREGQRAKRAYRAAVGYVTEAELRALLGAHHGRFADKVRRQLALLAADREAAA